MIQPIQLGWMAGIIDLKGKFVYKANKQRATQQTTMYVESRHQPVVKRLGEMTGLNPESKKHSHMKEWLRKGCVEHCPDKHFHVTEESTMPELFRWTITGASLAIVLYNILPFLVLTEKNYEDVMNKIIQDTPLTGQGSGRTVWAIRRMSMLSWDIPDEFEGVLE